MLRVSIGLLVLLATVLNFVMLNNFAFKPVRQLESNARKFNALHYDELARNQDGHFDVQLLSHRLIALDKEFSVADERTAGQSIVNVNAYLSGVHAKCVTNGSDEGNAAYVACAGNLIGKHFYHYPGAIAASHYAQHRSGGETNTYLMIDATKHLPISGSIVFSPGHAFFAWKDSFGEYQYWETTANDNAGKLADLQTPLYVRNPDRTYYTPLKGAIIEDVYLAEIYEVAAHKPDLERLYQQNFENMRIADVYFNQKSRNFALPGSDVKMTEHGARYLRSLLQTDVSSVSKRIALARYYLSTGNQHQALKFVDDINPSACFNDCYLTSVEAGKASYVVFEPLYRWFYEHNQARGYTPSAADYLSAVFLLNTFIIFHVGGALILLFFIRRGTCRLV